MNITDIRVRKLLSEGNVLALVSISIDGEFAIHDIKVVRGAERNFIAMPSRRGNDGVFRDVVHPISSEVREQLEAQILAAYNEKVAMQQMETAAAVAE